MLNIARLKHVAVGNKVSGLVTSGVDKNSTTRPETEEFNGNVWSFGGNINDQTFRGSSSGIPTAALLVEGIFSSSSEIYDGTSWSITGSLNTLYFFHKSAGIVTATVSFGGLVSSVDSDVTEEFNGTTWSVTGANLNTARSRAIGFGAQNDAICATGQNSGTAITSTESYNGTTWSLVSGGDVNLQRIEGAGSGTSSNAIKSGGRPGFVATPETEKFNGTTWSLFSDLVFAVTEVRSAGEPESVIVAGGSTTLDDSQAVAIVQAVTPTGRKKILSGLSKRDAVEYIIVGDGAESEGLTYAATIGVSTSWAIGSASLNTSKFNFGADGSFSSAIAAGGDTGSASTATTEIYNGSGWAFTGSLNIGLSNQVGVGDASAAISVGGTDNYSLGVPGQEGTTDNTELFNGSTWSVTGLLSEARADAAGAGISTAAIVFAGITTESGFRNTTEHFNGSTWSAGGNVNLTRASSSGVGIETAALKIGGLSDEANQTFDVEEYNGTAWSIATSLNIDKSRAAAAGTANDTIFFGGYKVPEFEGSGATETSEIYNGSTWSSGPNLTQPIYDHGGAGNSSTQAMSIGGDRGGLLTNDVEYLEETAGVITQLLGSPPPM